MKPKMRCNLSAAFAAHTTSEGRWRLASREPREIEVYLQGVRGADCEFLTGAALSHLDIEWQDRAVVLHMDADAGPRSLQMQTAIVHQPLPRLYSVLPLPPFDCKGRRFWRRVFILVRIPGGRHLLGTLARRSRNPR